MSNVTPPPGPAFSPFTAPMQAPPQASPLAHLRAALQSSTPASPPAAMRPADLQSATAYAAFAKPVNMMAFNPAAALPLLPPSLTAIPSPLTMMMTGMRQPPTMPVMTSGSLMESMKRELSRQPMAVVLNAAMPVAMANAGTISTVATMAHGAAPLLSSVPASVGTQLNGVAKRFAGLDAVQTLRNPQATPVEKTLAVVAPFDRTGIAGAAKDALGGIRERDSVQMFSGVASFAVARGVAILEAGVAAGALKPRTPAAAAAIVGLQGAIALAPAIRDAVNGPSKQD